jgi:hypothetical protein
VNEFGMYPSNNDTVRRWMAERENAEARMELARMRECCRVLNEMTGVEAANSYPEMRRILGL